ncbi:Alpha-amylase [Saliniradius amylolyticus]|uniref:Alpha-amylase n=1 Tax=Saliniradius amylolyticus TaxID=2183582 RepID=A0A2S2E600_9ALTE|nr:alpha-amylase domain-containing protein [Saliniradius amylolyticus]AWL13063.1 Alpha-amylase [Saliniradius amylolyticus]
MHPSHLTRILYKKINAALLGSATLLSSLTLGAQELPQIPESEVNDTLYQAFYWDAYPGLWTELGTMARPLADAGITAMWLPPAAKAMNGTNSVGYDVYDFWDLGEFNQKGTIPTRYGTRMELEQALSKLDALGIDAYFDVVFNHRMGADAQEAVPGWGDAWTEYQLQGRQTHYTNSRWGVLWHDFDWNWQAFDASGGNLFPDKGWDYTYSYDYLMGEDVDWGRQDTRDEMKAWGQWVIDTVGFNGFRMDATAHIDTDFTHEWVEHMQANTAEDLFFVAESWVGNIGGYLDQVGSEHLNAFDFGLRDDFVALSSGSKDMRWWGGLINSAYADQAVTFVDNHDTSREGNPYNKPQVTNFKNQAYAYILMREKGTPTVFARDYDEFGMAPTLTPLIEARRYFAYGPGHEFSGNTEAIYAYVREGLPNVKGTGLVMLISGRDWGTQQSFSINSRQPNTTFYDYTGNVDGTVTTDANGMGQFPVSVSEADGWSIWVPQLSTQNTITLKMTKDVGMGNSLYFTGNTSELTNWGGGVEGTWTEGNVWKVTIQDPGQFEWKVRKGATGSTGEQWESGANHDHTNLHPLFNGGF